MSVRLPALRPSRRSRGVPGQSVSRGRAGMTLVELMVAIFILSVALLGLAGMAATVTRQLTNGGSQTIAAMLVQSRFDSLSSIAPCTNIVGAGATKKGSATRRGVTESWVITDGDDVIWVTDTLTLKQRSQKLVYQSILVCRD